MKNLAMKHTKNTWSIIYNNSDHVQIISNDNKEICSVDCFHKGNRQMSFEEFEANAKLIATAPELLQALKVCYNALCTYGKHPIIDNQVNNAFKKATE